MLDPYRMIGNQAVEHVPIEIAGHRLVIADGPDPLARPAIGGCSRQHRRQGPQIADPGRSDLERPAGLGQGQDVEVVVVQAGQHRATAQVQLVVAGKPAQSRSERSDPIRLDTQVAPALTDDLGPAQDEGGQRTPPAPRTPLGPPTPPGARGQQAERGQVEQGHRAVGRATRRAPGPPCSPIPTPNEDTLPEVSEPLTAAAAVALLGRLRSGRGADELGAPVGRPVLLVDLDEPVRDLALQPPAGWPVVIVATSSAPTAPAAPCGADVLISAAADPPAPWVGVPGGGMGAAAAARTVEAAVGASPQAATTLAQVLRAGSALGPSEALVLESLAYSTLQSGVEHQTWLEGRPVRRADTRSDPVVQLDRQGDELWVTLDRPERRNAYSARMRDELVVALQLAAADPTVTAVHLAGRGPNFSSGGDLAEFGTRPDPAAAHGIRVQHSAGWWIDRLKPRVTVHLHGACVGAGIELAAFAGVVEATEGTTMSLPEVGMGLIPGAGGTASIPRRIGRPRTAWLAITGHHLDAATACQWGLVDRLVPAPETAD